jgi:hypothetical protein
MAFGVINSRGSHGERVPHMDRDRLQPECSPEERFRTQVSVKLQGEQVALADLWYLPLRIYDG